MKQNNDIIECWDIFELAIEGRKEGNPFVDTCLTASFKYGNRVVETDGFYDGDGIYRVRFMPDKKGAWTYETRSNDPEMNGITGKFECTPPSPGNHGLVRIRSTYGNTYHFVYDDNTPYFPVGTTIYSWAQQSDKMEEQTLETLEKSAFNKIRMVIPPYYEEFNDEEPVYQMCEFKEEKIPDYTRFNTEFFRHLEKRLGNLRGLGIEADLILFHCYDRWGYTRINAEDDERYLKYVISRFASYRNVWWSLANEYDLLLDKTTGDWDRRFKTVQEYDPYRHLRSIHNCGPFYDHAKPWVTHCSIQRVDVYKTAENVDDWRRQYKKPVIVDECAYEGNAHFGWGNITGEEMLRRCWEGFVRGGYVVHGETYMSKENSDWWVTKGGVLRGTSHERMGFLRKIMEEGPAEGIAPIYMDWDVACGGKEGEYYLVYFGFNQPSFKDLNLPAGKKFKIELIDTWNMTIKRVEGEFSGRVRICLPSKQYMALRIRKI